MLAAMVLAALIATGSAAGPPPPMAVPSVPSEPDAFFLPEAPTYQAVAADLDGDGTRDVVRLVGDARGSILAEAWIEGTAGWRLAGGVEVVPGLTQGTIVTWAGAPARLLVRRVGDVERVTIARQPSYQEPGLEADCCLLLDDLALRDGTLRLESVTPAGDIADTVLVIDLDGDRTDELLVTRSLPPLGDISFPTEARVYRWASGSFGAPTVTQLPMGSGDTPFVLGDSDGRPGDEAAIISSAGTRTLHRIGLGSADSLRVENSGLVASEAMAVPVDEGRGMALVGPPMDVSVVSWPAGGTPDAPIGEAPIPSAHLLGTVGAGDEQRLLVRQGVPTALHALLLPTFSAIRATGVARSPASAAFESGPVHPYAGPLPGGGPDGSPAAIFHGRLIPSDDGDGPAFPIGDSALMASLAGAQPVGLVGRDRAWLALLHAPLRTGLFGATGGLLGAPVAEPGSGVSLAPLTVVRQPEEDAGDLDPPVTDAAAMDGRGTLAVGVDGFTALVEAPPGSRVYLAEADPSVLGAVRIVPEAGSLRVGLTPATVPGSGAGRQRLGLAVVTPAGHGYLGTWEVRVLTEPPALDARATTSFGSASVRVAGRTAPYARVTVAGEPVEVNRTGDFSASVVLPPWPTAVTIVATDPIGHAASTTVLGVGLFDYRGLPWVPITIACVALAGLALFLRVPRSRSLPRAAGDDSALEELEPD